MTDIRIAVIGAGIGGLTTAIALAEQGIRCTVFERAGTLPEVGGGIQLPPNASAVLHRLGLAAALAGAVRPDSIELRRWQNNAVLGRIELGAAASARYGAPYCTLRRTDLCRALYAAVLRRCGPGTVRFGHRCTGVTERPYGVEIRFDDGTVHRADAVIGADGINSTVRRLVVSDTARYSGHTVYRAVLPAARVPWMRAPHRVRVWLGPGRHCVGYPIDGGRAVNLVATVPAGEPPPRGHGGDADTLIAAYAGWHPAVHELFAAAGHFDHHGLYDRPAPPRRHRGRLALIGDAAQPMLPFIAQGAAQAIEDAAMIADCVREPGGFARYDATRQPRVARVHAAARAGSRDHHLPDGPDQQLRDARIADGGLAAQDWLYAPAVGAR